VKTFEGEKIERKQQNGEGNREKRGTKLDLALRTWGGNRKNHSRLRADRDPRGSVNQLNFESALELRFLLQSKLRKVDFEAH